MAEIGETVTEDELPKKQGAYLKGSDVAGKVLRAKITNTGSTTFADGRKVRTLYVLVTGSKEEQSFALNRNNTQTIAQAFGSKVSEWIGKSIQLTGTKATNPQTGTQVDSILVIAS